MIFLKLVFNCVSDGIFIFINFKVSIFILKEIRMIFVFEVILNIDIFGIDIIGIIKF